MKFSDLPKSKRSQSGFTLLEMLAVIVLIGIVATIVVRQVGNNVEKGKYAAGKAQLTNISMKIENFRLDVGKPPETLRDLVFNDRGYRGWSGPYAKKSDLLDPFQHEFHYQSPAINGSYDLIFLGADGALGGTGLNADVGIWE